MSQSHNIVKVAHGVVKSVANFYKDGYYAFFVFNYRVIALYVDCHFIYWAPDTYIITTENILKT